MPSYQCPVCCSSSSSSRSSSSMSSRSSSSVSSGSCSVTCFPTITACTGCPDGMWQYWFLKITPAQSCFFSLTNFYLKKDTTILSSGCCSWNVKGNPSYTAGTMQLVNISGTDTWKIDLTNGSSGTADYRLDAASFDCLGDNTFSLFAQTGSCTTMPSTCVLSPTVMCETYATSWDIDMPSMTLHSSISVNCGSPLTIPASSWHMSNIFNNAVTDALCQKWGSDITAWTADMRMTAQMFIPNYFGDNIMYVQFTYSNHTGNPCDFWTYEMPIGDFQCDATNTFSIAISPSNTDNVPSTIDVVPSGLPFMFAPRVSPQRSSSSSHSSSSFCRTIIHEPSPKKQGCGCGTPRIGTI